jgi:outer membrane protein
MNRMIRNIALMALLSGAGLAQAQQSTVKFGVARYQTHAQTTGITGIGIPPGADAQIGSATTVLATYEYEVMPDLGVELALGIPPRIKAKASGSVAFLGDVLEAKNQAPTLLVNYHFGKDGDPIRPYVGAGINYTRFIGISSPYGWQVSLKDSWGPTVQVGLNCAIDKQWGGFASIAAVKTKSDLVAIGATVLQTTIDFKPVVYSAGLYYRF